MPFPIEIECPRRMWPMRRRYRRDLPASFREVEEGRRLPLWRALLSAAGEAGRIAALRVLLGLPAGVFRKLTGDHLAALLDALPWLVAKPDPVPALTTFRYQDADYFFPSAHGMNLVAIEYPLADKAFMDYVTAGKPEALRMLCGVLLRERDTDEQAIIRRNDPRVPLLSRGQAQHRSEQFGTLPEEIQQAALLFFAGLKEFVSNSYGKVLFEEPETDEQGNPIQTSTTPSMGWWSVYWSVAESGPFGNDVKQVYQTGFHDVCLYLVDRIRQQKEAEMKAKLASKGFGES